MTKAQKRTQKAIKAIRDVTGLTQSQLAEMIGASLDAVKGWTREKNPSPIFKQFETAILFATGAVIKDDGSVVAFLSFPTEPFTKDTFDFWRAHLFKSNEVIADRCARRCADSIRRIFRAACQPVRGQRSLPAIWSSFCDWEKDTIKKFNLSRRMEKSEDEYKSENLRKKIVLSMQRMIARQNARLPACKRLTQSEENEKFRTMIDEIVKKLAVANKKPATVKSRA
jgi:transcriptional regulator with XRE-family HTH domain